MSWVDDWVRALRSKEMEFTGGISKVAQEGMRASPSMSILDNAQILSSAMGKPYQMETLNRMGILNPYDQVKAVVDDSLNNTATASGMYRAKGKIPQADALRDETYQNADNLINAGGTATSGIVESKLANLRGQGLISAIPPLISGLLGNLGDSTVAQGWRSIASSPNPLGTYWEGVKGLFSDIGTEAGKQLQEASNQFLTAQDYPTAIKGMFQSAFAPVNAFTEKGIKEPIAQLGTEVSESPSIGNTMGTISQMLADPTNLIPVAGVLSGKGGKNLAKQLLEVKGLPEWQLNKIEGIQDALSYGKSFGVAKESAESLLKTPLEIRPKFGEWMDVPAKEFDSLVNRNKNEMFIHPNKKTKYSVDWSTSCPRREGCMGSCLYCYGEQPRIMEELGIPNSTHGKKIVETPYDPTVLEQMPNSTIQELNKDGGLRMFSFGDYRPDVDFEQTSRFLDDAYKKGLKVRAITKSPEFVQHFGDYPNLTINISTDELPRHMSNAMSVMDAQLLKAERPNIKIRTVALNEQQAMAALQNPNIDVVTLYHGATGEKLWQIIQKQNPAMIQALGEDAVKAEIMTWQDMRPRKEWMKAFPGKLCCEGGKCSKDSTKCGLGAGEFYGKGGD